MEMLRVSIAVMASPVVLGIPSNSQTCDVTLNDYQSYEDVDLVNIRTNGVVELMDC